MSPFHHARVISLRGVAVGLREYPRRDAVLFRGIKCLQLLQTMRGLVLVADVLKAVRSRVCRPVRLSRPEQVCVSDRPQRAAVSDWLVGQGDLAGCRVTELGCRGFRGRNTNEFPVPERGHCNTQISRCIAERHRQDCVSLSSQLQLVPSGNSISLVSEVTA